MLPMVVAHQKAQESARKPLVAPIWPRLPGLTARPGTSVGTRSRSAASSEYLRRSGSCVCAASSSALAVLRAHQDGAAAQFVAVGAALRRD